MQENIVEHKKCKSCGTYFEITDKDLEFYDKVSPIFNNVKYQIPTPNLCPDCRQQRRLARRNERKLYKRSCDATGKQVISMYSPDKKYKVYDQTEWWSDRWDALDYGQEFDFNKTFFEQFGDVFHSIPHYSNFVINSENCDYNTILKNSKKCYMCTFVSNSELTFYSSFGGKMINCIDCYSLIKGENCYFCVNCISCFNCKYVEDSQEMTNCSFCRSCIGCDNCFGCINLINQQYCYLNQQLSKEEYEKVISQINLQDIGFKDFIKNFNDLKLDLPVKNLNIASSENCMGDYISHSSYIYKGYEIIDSKNFRYSYNSGIGSSDCIDIDYCGGDAVLICEGLGLTEVFGAGFCYSTKNCKYIYYCCECYDSSNLFGCVGLRNKQYCILNKQYTKEEYELLVPKIIEHMQKMGEWGEFFPVSISPFGYNETIAMDYFHISREDALSRGYKRQDKEYPINIPQGIGTIKAVDLPDNISDVGDDILTKAILCEISGKPFRIVKPELDFYRKHKLPLPRRHPDQRHLDRLAKRNPRKLYDRNCDKCGIGIKTTFEPFKAGLKIYCEQCYHKEVDG